MKEQWETANLKEMVQVDGAGRWYKDRVQAEGANLIFFYFPPCTLRNVMFYTKATGK
ncbi:MAG: hypothetical protein K0R75_3548 [Paenibacillaceae bacterium]|jgi:hypothetical protein|nr:hypothetical protein [Paenibacillaceae bacterium]